MVSKTEKIYLELLPLKVVTFNEILDEAKKIIGSRDPRYIHLKYVKRLSQEGKLHRIRRGLYAVIPLLEDKERYVPDKFLIASKIRDNYYLGYHTALEFYGCAYSHFNEVYVALKKGDRFDTFGYKNLKFRPVFIRDTGFGVEEKKYMGCNVRISSKERTFIDCLDRVKYAGGWEESLKSLQGLGGLNFDNLNKTLQRYDNELLFRKAGFVLTLLRDTSVFYEHFSDKMLNRWHKRIGKSPRYLADEKPFIYNKKWHLYIPEKFEEKLRGI
ncbi:MAG: type IV toxin-antitoxin system AbiEi family antitoxin [Candidatus Hydrothermarchaeales archaeon]